MGLFSGGTETTVATSVQRMVPDNALPEAIKAGAIGAVFRNENVAQTILDNLIGGIGFKAERLFEYAKTHYPHGLPSGQYLVNNQGITEVTAVLQALEGAPVTVSYSRLSVPNFLHIGWLTLMTSYGYNPATNQLATLTAQKGTPVFMTDLVVHVPPSLSTSIDPEALEQWGLSPKTAGLPQEIIGVTGLNEIVGFTPVTIDTAATAAYVELQYWWMANTARQSATVQIPVTGYDAHGSYLHVRYTVGSTVKYWMYRLGTGTYPTLDGLIDTPPQTYGTFFPFAYFRYNKASTTANKTTPVYQATRHMLKYLNIDYDAVADAINTNPDIADVEQAMLVFGVPANSTNPLEQRYLFEFFDALYAGTGAQYSSAIEEDLQRQLFARTVTGMAPRSALVIRDAQFKLSLSNTGLYKKRVPGVMGPVGSYSVTQTTTPRSVQYRNKDSGTVSTSTINAPTHVFRHQVSDVTYDQIEVVNLQLQYFIWGEYTTSAVGNDANLLIPLDHTITAGFTTVERERLYARSLHYVFNSRVVTELAWYQSDFFQFVIIAASVVLLVVTYGASWQEFAAALAATGLTTAMVITVLTAIVKFAVASYAFKLFAKEVGGEIAMIVAIVAVAAGLKMGGLSPNGAPLATNLLAAGNGLMKAVGDYYREEIVGLQEEFQQMNRQEEERSTLLEQANKLLEQDSMLSPLTFFGETPDQYYTRTVHSGNIGIIGIDAVSNYVERSLSLPTLPERFGGLADV